MRDWFKPIDIYCERVDASWWAEPLNALTNLAFVLAGLLIMRQRHGRSMLLGMLIVAIGIGSFLFHTHANRLTGLIDVAFIGIYLATYAWLWPLVVWQKSGALQVASVIALAGMILLTTLVNQGIKPVWPDVPPGVYTGAWLFLMALAVLSKTKQPSTSSWLWLTAALFLGSLTARQLDMPLCQSTGGTHWLWHVLNACVLYASARALTVNVRSDVTG